MTEISSVSCTVCRKAKTRRRGIEPSYKQRGPCGSSGRSRNLSANQNPGIECRIAKYNMPMHYLQSIPYRGRILVICVVITTRGLPFWVLWCFVHVCFAQVTILKLVWRSRLADAPRCAHFPTDICAVIQEGEITVAKCAQRGASAHQEPHTLSHGRNKLGHNNSAPIFAISKQNQPKLFLWPMAFEVTTGPANQRLDKEFKGEHCSFSKVHIGSECKLFSKKKESVRVQSIPAISTRPQSLHTLKLKETLPRDRQ